MPWVRLDDHFDEHPKLAAVGALGMALWAAGLAYCNRNLTDGVIPVNVARRLISTDGLFDATGKELRPRDVIEALLAHGLWEHEGEDYRVHDYLDFQPSREQVLEMRDKARVRMQGHRSSREVRTNTTRSSDAPTPTPTPVPVPTPEREPATQAQRKRREPAPKLPAPPAVEVYRETYERYPKRAQYQTIAVAVGESEDALRLWRTITATWRDRGYKPQNIVGQLECFSRGEVSSNGRNNGHGRDSPLTEPRGWAGIREMEADDDRRGM